MSIALLIFAPCAVMSYTQEQRSRLATTQRQGTSRAGEKRGRGRDRDLQDEGSNNPNLGKSGERGWVDVGGGLAPATRGRNENGSARALLEGSGVAFLLTCCDTHLERHELCQCQCMKRGHTGAAGGVLCRAGGER